VRGSTDRPFGIPHDTDQRLFIPPPAATTIAATMSQLAKKDLLEEVRPISAPPTVVNEPAELGPHVTRATIAPGPTRGSGTVTPSIGPTLSTRESILAAHLDITPSLQKAVHSVVKARNGSVLSRGFILKTDHYPSGECSKTSGEGRYRAVIGALRSAIIRPQNFPFTGVILGSSANRCGLI
jgi:hypothetical protein